MQDHQARLFRFHFLDVRLRQHGSQWCDGRKAVASHDEQEQEHSDKAGHHRHGRCVLLFICVRQGGYVLGPKYCSELQYYTVLY